VDVKEQDGDVVVEYLNIEDSHLEEHSSKELNVLLWEKLLRNQLKS